MLWEFKGYWVPVSGGAPLGKDTKETENESSVMIQEGWEGGIIRQQLCVSNCFDVGGSSAKPGEPLSCRTAWRLPSSLPDIC